MQNHEQMLCNARQICELQNFIIARIREREAEPREDMISDLVHAQGEDGSKLRICGSSIAGARAAHRRQ